jgi:release factor glutamine methyltransferase
VNAGEALRKYTSILKQHGLDEAAEDAKVLLCSVLGLGISQLFAQSDRALSDEELHRMEGLIDKRINRVPTAYLINSRQFYGMDFYVDSRVLIPRPETEVLVEEAIKFGQEWRKKNQGVMNIADVGTGSGAIAVALASNIPGSTVYATDISEDALSVAAINIQKHGLEGRIKLSKGYLLQQIIEKLHMVVANLPYIKESDLALLPPEISKHEPRAALDGGKYGTEMIQELIRQSAGKIAAGGAVLLEIGIGQEEGIIRTVEANLPGAKVELTKDLSDINRVLKIVISSFDNDIGLL